MTFTRAAHSFFIAGLFTVVVALAGAGAASAATLAEGWEHSCAIRAGGTVVCWGNDAGGQLGNGTPLLASATPVTVKGVAGVVDLAAGKDHTCAVLIAGTVSCWGKNDLGQLGIAGPGPGPEPVAVPGVSGAVAVAAGGGHSCALLEGGRMKCWGDTYGQAFGGDGSGITDVVQLAASYYATCALRQSGQVQCWGLGSPPFTDALQVVTGRSYACALRTGGTISCWGDGQFGQLGGGIAAAAAATAPTTVVGISDATALAAGDSHACAVRAGGAISCWGANERQQLGAGAAETQRIMPVPVLGSGGPLTGATALAGGLNSTCSLKAAGTVWCWVSTATAKSARHRRCRYRQDR